jgi:sulfoxide reductase heme-binding subunit YedZ
MKRWRMMKLDFLSGRAPHAESLATSSVLVSTICMLLFLAIALALALYPTPALAAAAAPDPLIAYSAQLSGQVQEDTLLGTDSQGDLIHHLLLTASLHPTDAGPALALRFDLSEALLPDAGIVQGPDVLPGGGTVSAAGLLRGTAAITDPGGTITVYVAETRGLYLEDSSLHFDLEGAGAGQAQGGKASLFVTIAPHLGTTLSGQASGSLDLPQAALDLLNSHDPLAGPTLWYLMRASGLAALALLTATILIGLALRVRLWQPTLERWRVYDLHLTVSILLAVFLALHLLVVFLDRVVPFSLLDILIPLHASYQPLWIAAGILALYLLLVVWGSSLIRSKISYSLWRRLHPLALGALGLVMLHALFAGTDGPTLWLRAALALIALAVVWLFLLWMRLKPRRPQAPTPRQPNTPAWPSTPRP